MHAPKRINLIVLTIILLLAFCIFTGLKGTKRDYEERNISEKNPVSIDTALNKKEYLGKLLFFEKP